MKQNPEVAFGLFVAGVNALLVAALFTWADIRPESDWWALSPSKVALVGAAPNFAPAILLWRTRRNWVAPATTAITMVLAGGYECWQRWASMTYDRGTVSAWGESAFWVLETTAVALFGIACLVAGDRVVRAMRAS